MTPVYERPAGKDTPYGMSSGVSVTSVSSRSSRGERKQAMDGTSTVFPIELVQEMWIISVADIGAEMIHHE